MENDELMRFGITNGITLLGGYLERMDTDPHFKGFDAYAEIAGELEVMKTAFFNLLGQPKNPEEEE